MFPVDKRVEQRKKQTFGSIIHGTAPAYLRVDISLNDNASHQTGSSTTFSFQTS